MFKKIVFIVAFSVLNISVAVAAAQTVMKSDSSPCSSPYQPYATDFRLPAIRLLPGYRVNLVLGRADESYGGSYALLFNNPEYVVFPATRVYASSLPTGLTVSMDKSGKVTLTGEINTPIKGGTFNTSINEDANVAGKIYTNCAAGAQPLTLENGS